MSITPIGWILLPTGAALLLLSPQWLYACFVFFIPFSATAVINIGSSESASGLQASMYFGSLWLCAELIRPATTLRITIPKDLTKPFTQMLLFGVVAVSSLSMPLLINGGLEVASADLLSTEAIPLRFTLQHVTQAAYLIYGILIALFVAKRLCDRDEIYHTLKVLLASTLFVSVWGFLQWFLYLFDFPYPAVLFNSSETKSALGFGTSFEDFGLKRISSVAVEPSLFAQYLLVIVPLVLFALLSKRTILSRFWNATTLASMILVLLLSTSGSAYLGLALVVLLIVLCCVRIRLLRPAQFGLIVLLTVVLIVVYLYVPFIGEFVNDQVLGKFDTYSGLERVNTVVVAAGYFARYPILGIGWGSATSHDLIIKLLSNTGLVGCATFLLFVITILSRLIRAARRRESQSEDFDNLALVCCSLVSVTTLIVLNAVTGFAFAFAHFWFVLGLGMAAPYMVQKYPRSNQGLKPEGVAA